MGVARSWGMALRAGLLACLAAVVLSAGLAPAAAQAGGQPPALVYVFRPIGGKFMGKEMDRLAERLKAQGFAVTINNYTAFAAPAKEAVRLYKAAPVKPRIIALGYSAGGDSAIRFSLVLRKAQVPVDLVLALDPTRIANRVPSNVQRFVNLYSSEHTMGGGTPKPAKDYKGYFATVDVKDYTSAAHLDISAVAGLQDAMFAKIVEVAGLPPGPVAASVPIAYTPPAGGALVIWDYGVPATAGAGDTVESVAGQFDVPAWLFAEVNGVKDGAALKAGQRIVVPQRMAGR